jgi:hypothetical protein
VAEGGEFQSVANGALSEFIEKTFAGNLGNSENFYLVLGNTPIQFLSILKSIRKLSPKVSLEIHQPKNKTSLIINLELNGKIYSLTKIEPSFEGAGSKISQTKGIIYHFQQYPNTSNSNHFKKLFFDISKKVVGYFSHDFCIQCML